MDSLFIYNSENFGSGDKPNEKDGVLGSMDGISGRKKLAEITNLPCPPKLSFRIEKNHTVSLSPKDFIHQLQNENMAIEKMLFDRNKLIESSRLELHKLRVNLEKMQLQNLQLAQANSQLLQELNLGKDRLKALQHELGCKNGLLKTLQLEVNGASILLQSQARPAAYQECLDEAQRTKGAKEGVPYQLDTKKKNELCENFGCSDLTRQSNRQSLCNSVKVGARKKADIQDSLPRRRSTRPKCDVSQTIKDVLVTDEVQIHVCSVTADPACESTSGAHEDSVRKAEAKKKADNQDTRSRRLSKRLRLDVMQASKNTSETNKTETPVLLATAGAAQNDDSESVVKNENIEVGSLTTGFQVSHRLSTGRPLRHAAVRIQSYKEVPINVKMRRAE